MQKEHNKILLAGELLVEAANEFRQAKSDVGYAKSILLAGAVSLITTPYLSELGIDSMHESLAKAAVQMDGTDISKLTAKQLYEAVGKGIGYYRFTYNSLKHSGDKRRDIKPSDDLNFTANLREEANWLIDAAISDFSRLPHQLSTINNVFSDELRTLLQSPWNFSPIEDKKRLSDF